MFVLAKVWPPPPEDDFAEMRLEDKGRYFHEDHLTFSLLGHGPPRPATQPPFSMKCRVHGELIYSASARPTPIIQPSRGGGTWYSAAPRGPGVTCPTRGVLQCQYDGAFSRPRFKRPGHPRWFRFLLRVPPHLKGAPPSCGCCWRGFTLPTILTGQEGHIQHP